MGDRSFGEADDERESRRRRSDVNGHASEEENGKKSGRYTSSPSGRSATPQSDRSDGSRRRIENDVMKEPVTRSVSPRRSQQRYRGSSPSPRKRERTRSRSRSRSPKRRSRRRHSRESPRRSRSRSRSRGHRRESSDDRNRNGRRSRSPRRSPARRPSPRRSGGGGGGGGRFARRSERDNPQPSRCLGVFGLSTQTREKDIRHEFQKFGPLSNIQLIHDHRTGRSRGFAFVYFTDLKDAEEARESMNGSLLDERRIRVDYSLTQRSSAMTILSPARRSRSRSRSRDRRRHS
ncbi:hypothetical protein RvY_09401 [Ramazzottius varieornatus]|uniref:RRM domain-containing protein n=1 Tax=Ramazzottius varieornatus TaxID=947166 RepID=A0A1D1VBN3_RAMVA|nr:hypothetical protein RvY_09401 [Ramazzottius varieornatus]